MTCLYSTSLRTGSRECLGNMIDSPNLSLYSEKIQDVNREAILCLNACLCSRDVSRGQNFKMKEIGELVAIYYGWFKKWTFLTEENLSDPTLKPLEWLSFCNNTLNFPQAGMLEKGLLVVTCPSAGAQVLTKIIKIKAVETVTKLSKT